MKKKLTYKEIRQIIIDKCIEKRACVPEFTKLKAAKTETEFWEVIKQNGYWSVTNSVITVELLEQYSIKTLNKNQIFIDGGKREVKNNTLCININGTVSENYGTVSYNGNYGTVSKNYGTVSENNGTVSENYGTVSYNGNYGTVSYNGNYGTVSKNYGTVSENYGTVSYNGNYGTVSYNGNYGTVSYNGNYGTVSKNYGNAVVIERNKKRIYIKKGEFEIVYFD